VSATQNPELAEAIEVLKWCMKSEDARRINAMVELARSEPGVPVVPSNLNRNHWLLNCPNGTLNLRTGRLHEHRREDLITNVCPTEYHADATCPRWLRFLDGVFEQKHQLVRYVQKYLGYCLTGDVTEQVLGIFWGAGANGKSTLINTFLDTVGEDYAIKASRDLFMAKKQDTHPAQLARLFGKRLVVAIETENGCRLDEALIKELTGGDPITARGMKENPWQFKPTHKAILVTNHKPDIRGTDEGIWRRPRLVPFTVRFWNPDDPDDLAKNLPAALKQDKDLRDALLAERPGILAWCVEGCLDWQRQGLGMPEEVKAATKQYRSEQDLLAAFFAEHCLLGADYRCRAGEFYARFRVWCEASGEAKGSVIPSQRKVGESLTERGFERYTSNGTWYRGLALRTEETEPLPH
jgi:putative DNA primase/helicase